MRIFPISQQDTFTWLCIGIKDADERQQKVAEVAGILKGADIDYKDQGDIEVEIWRKYILNCAFNVMTAFYDNTIGELRRDPVKAQQYVEACMGSCQCRSGQGGCVDG